MGGARLSRFRPPQPCHPFVAVQTPCRIYCSVGSAGSSVSDTELMQYRKSVGVS